MVRFWKGQTKVLAIAIVLTNQIPDIFAQILNGFDKMAAIQPFFNCLSFRISHPIGVQIIYNTTSYWPFQIETSPDFRSLLF